jgi:hypothetical protein
VYSRHLIHSKSSLKAVVAAVEEDQVLALVNRVVEQDQVNRVVEQDQVNRVVEQDQVNRVVEQDQVGQAVLVNKAEWVGLTNTSRLIIQASMDTTDTMDTLELVVNGWVIPGIGGADMVTGVAGTTVTLVGGGIPGMAILGGGGTEIIGGAGYPAGAPSLVRTDPPLSFYFTYVKLS